MRPTDENQHGSTRPNLMSASRQGGGEDNILAMLERDAGRGLGSQFSSQPRTAWYSVAGALVVAMVGALGWLAWENANKAPELMVETTLVLPSGGETSVAAAPSEAPAPVAHSAGVEPPFHPDVTPSHGTAPPPVQDAQAVPVIAAAVAVQPGPAAPQTGGAAIIDNPAPPAEAAVLLAQATPAAPAAPEAAKPSGLPPLVLLPPEEAGPKRTPTAAIAATESKSPATNPVHADTPPASRPAAKADAAPRALTKPIKAPRLAARADAAPKARSAAKVDTAAPTRASAKAPARRAEKTVVARARKAPAPATAAASAKSQDAAADGDVALISAIIMHSSRHAAERAKAESAKSCDGGKCAGKTAKQ